MNFLEFFTGTDREKRARETMNKLKDRTDLKPKEQRQLEEAKSMTRARFLRLLGTGAGLTIAGGVGYLLAISRSQISSSSKRDTTKNTSTFSPDVSLRGREVNDILPPHDTVTDLMDVAQVRSTYEEGFNALMKDIPGPATAADPYPVQVLGTLKHFKEQFVRWAVLRGDDYIALEQGTREGAWLAVIPPDNKRALNPNMNILGIDSGADHNVNALLAKPIKMTPRWAGVVLTHELTHLMDRVYQVESKNPTADEYLQGEVRSYGAEIYAVDHLTNGRFSQALEELIREYNPTSFSQINNLFVTNSPIAHSIFEALEKASFSEPSMSPGEKSLRIGFYIIALGFTIARQQFPQNPELFEAYRKVVHEAMTFGGEGRHIPSK